MKAAACLAAVLGLGGLGPANTAQAQGIAPAADLPGPAPVGSPSPSPSPTATPGRPAPLQVDIFAPPALKALLERHLDLTRLAVLAPQADLSGAELARLVDAAPQQARELLQTEGYFDADVRAEVVRTSDEGVPQHIRLQVQPGALTRVTRFDLEVEGELARAAEAGDPAAKRTLDSLREAWPLKPGAPLRNADWSDAKTTTLARLRAAGYATAMWSGTTAQVDLPRQQARLYGVADTGPLFRSGELRIDGLALHGREAVTHLAGFGPGTPVTETLLLDFQERLQKSGLFEHASVTLDTDPTRAAGAALQVQVREQARHQLITGLGFSTNAGPRATLEHIDRRFLGQAATARNKFEWGRDRQAWDGEGSTHVRADRYRWFVGGTIERLLTDTDTVLSQRLRAGRTMDSPRIERTQFLELDRARRSTAQALSISTALTANQRWVWRDVDNPLLPTDGQTLSVQLGAGAIRGTDSGDGPLARGLVRLTAYRPLGRSGWFAQGRVEAGHVLAPGVSTLTENLGFRAGGDESVRGYAHRSLGPVRQGAVASGKLLLTSSAELARPLSRDWPSVWGAAFVDMGQAADRWGDWKPAFGYGLGVRWRSPVGPLKLDLAYGHETRRVRVHFSVGIVF